MLGLIDRGSKAGAGADLLEDRHILLNENLTIRNLMTRNRVHSFAILGRVSSKKLSRHCPDHARLGYSCIVEARRGECRVQMGMLLAHSDARRFRLHP